MSAVVHWTRGAAVCLAIAAPAFASAHTISIVNGTRTAMVSLQARQADTAVWQKDLLGNHPLGIQKPVDFTVPDKPNCFFELKAMFEDGHRLNKKANLCKSNTYLLTDF
ncbi:MAG TPA: hypothetical protein VKB71_06205 [Rhizomicrobium sp.]|nr:hypothetical protein [Rhizomicrobium sp.]